MIGKKPFLKLCAISCLLAGCSDSDTVDSTITPVYVEVVEALLIEESNLIVIEEIDPLLSPPKDEPTRTTLISNFKELILLDTDDSSERDNDNFVNDRGVIPELAIHTKFGDVSRVYLTDLKSRREQVLFDLNTNQNQFGDQLVCEIKPLDIPDLLRFKDDRLEIKQSNEVLVLTAFSDCDNQDQLQLFTIMLSSSDTNYFVRQPLLKEQEEGSSEPDVYEIANVSYSEFDTTRQFEDESLSGYSNLIFDLDGQVYGYLDHRYDDNANSSVFSMNALIDETETETYQLWTESVSPAYAASNPFHVINAFIDTSNPYAIIVNNRLLQISKQNAFNLVQQANRSVDLNNPVYTWMIGEDALTQNINILNTGTIALLDGEQLEIIRADDSRSTRTFASGFTLENLTKSASNILLTKQASNETSTLSRIDESTLVETNIIGGVDRIITYDNQDYFDYYLRNDSSGIDQRFAQRLSLNQPLYNPALINSAWLQVRNYLEDTTQEYLLLSDNTNAGILRSPAIYVEDELATDGIGALVGTIEGDFAIIEMAAIISERVGMLWARSSFSETSTLAAYYFNPSGDQWSFTKVSDDTEFPAWLPYIEP